MSEHDVPDGSSLKGYTVITPDDSGADIVVKVFGASDKNMHNIPQKIKDGYNEAYNDGYDDGYESGYEKGKNESKEEYTKILEVVIPIAAAAIVGIGVVTEKHIIPFVKNKQLAYKQHKAQKQLQASARQNKQLPAPETDTVDVDCEESESASDDE